MSNESSALKVLLVEDEPQDLKIFLRDLPTVFTECGVTVTIYPCEDFADAIRQATDPLYQYDLIISDTYKGEQKNKDAQVLKIVNAYRKQQKFCPLIIYSSATRPQSLKTGPFTKWADKARSGELENAIRELLETGIPQVAHRLHSELDYSAGSYLWDFLQEQWMTLQSDGVTSPEGIERMIRKRAALKIYDADPGGEGTIPLMQRDASEMYIYPSLKADTFNLGDIIRSKRKKADLRVVLTPHCYLVKQPSQDTPKADYVLTVKVVNAETVLGQKLENAKKLSPTNKYKKLKLWARSPAQTEVIPSGRHWYLPGFLEIPHSFCDFLQSESLEYEQLEKKYHVVATLCSPYAEALQACFLSFFGSVGLPILNPASIENLLR